MEMLEKRDEELKHVKILATKAIAQAQVIQNRYKKGARDSDRKADLAMKIDSMNISMQFLTEKSKELQDKVTRLEQELEDKELECAMLRGGSPKDYGPQEKVAFSAALVNAPKNIQWQIKKGKKGFHQA